jgi:hypothetical protein
VTPTEWATIAVAISTLIGSFAFLVKWLVQHYLAELKPNSGSSLKDQVGRLEQRIDEIYVFLLQTNKGVPRGKKTAVKKSR